MTVSRQNYRTITLVASLLTLFGCSTTNYTANYPGQTTNQQSRPSESSFEEIVVSGTRAVAQPSNQRKKEITEEPLYETSVPILRDSNAQQIFKDYGVNPTISTANQQHSTFAMDVDTVSYQIAKASLNSNQLPNKASVRVEEFVNNFKYNYGSSDDVFSFSAEITPSPYRPGFHLLHVGVKAKHISDNNRLPANIVLIADVSGSMKSDDKMRLQKKALTTLVSQLNAKDSVAIIAYNTTAHTLLKPTKASKKRTIYNAIKKMKAGGGTNVETGLKQGYALAEEMAYPGHINRVILTSDGLANTGNIDPNIILKKIEDSRKRNIFLTTVGVGKSMFNDYLLEQLANKGNGNYLYLANQTDVEKFFVDGLTTQLQNVAKDAKIQLTFNPEHVQLFRQIGYENRGLQKQDFLDSNKDGGEVGSNQQVTVLYEIKLNNQSNSNQIANIALSYKKPQGAQVFSVNKEIPSSIIRSSTDAVSSDTIISMAVAAFAEKLRQSYWSRTYNYQQIQSELNSLPEQVRSSQQISELQDLVSKAKALDTRHDPYADRLPLSRINYDRVPLLR